MNIFSRFASFWQKLKSATALQTLWQAFSRLRMPRLSAPGKDKKSPEPVTENRVAADEQDATNVVRQY